VLFDSRERVAEDAIEPVGQVRDFATREQQRRDAGRRVPGTGEKWDPLTTPCAALVDGGHCRDAGANREGY
jgi:hypothetical protein